MPAPSVAERARRHAALGDPTRLAIVDELTRSDRSPKELGARFGLATNLLAHHLDVLEEAGLVRRFVSAGDRRRRYVRLCHTSLADLAPGAARPLGRALFVCSHNSARSQLAAALWTARTGHPASSAGTHPAERVHPGAVDAARRNGLDLSGAEPRPLRSTRGVSVVVTVCDRAHEELEADPAWWHWSIADPVEVGTADAFDAALADLDDRITTVISPPPPPTGRTDR